MVGDLLQYLDFGQDCLLIFRGDGYDLGHQLLRRLVFFVGSDHSPEAARAYHLLLADEEGSSL